MVNERRFNYYTLPDEHLYMNKPEGNQRSMYEEAYPAYHCPYCQSELAQSVFMNQFDGGQRSDLTNPRSQSNEEQRILQQFLNKDGQVDVQKMLQTIGQFADTVQQVSPVIREINDIIKSFRT